MSKKLKISGEIEIDPSNIIGLLSEEEAIEFICAVDLAFANMDFTDKVLAKLAKSVQADCSSEEWEHYKRFIKFLEGEAKS
jgi:hypothetical protein